MLCGADIHLFARIQTTLLLGWDGDSERIRIGGAECPWNASFA
jgi:hypothetical protein